ncbi:protein of unknown function [Pseudomonas sp. JV551A1]|uniref:Uncharacterized protein n=1 Tax=Pseudomonas inefficax TaxID=2078786 RepID=A0AAQ1SVV0_9PSED|nr:protein of unknown function [Pseudomonas sp. JV551A1]SPO63286.1 protein of unknown function [Pseudomonas inefficax]
MASLKGAKVVSAQAPCKVPGRFIFCACHGVCGACEIERRPRGASQHKAAPTSVSGQLFL